MRPLEAGIQKMFAIIKTTKFLCSRVTITRWLQEEILRPVKLHTSTQNDQKQQNKRTFSTVQAASLAAGISVLVFGYCCYKYNLLTSTKKGELEVYRNSLMDKTGHLVLLDRTWLPEILFKNTKTLKKIEDFRVYDGDVLIASFPKSGTTWIQEIVWQIVKGSENESNVNMEVKFPYLEYIYPGLEELKKQPVPRLIKTHIPYHYLPLDVQQGYGKVIYIARNPKDVSVSMYNFTKLLSYLHYKGDFNHFYGDFVCGKVAYGPWEDHVKDYWMHKSAENILFITYESLQKDTRGVVRQIAEFLGHKISDDHLTKIVSRTSFEVMKDNPLVNYSWWDDLGLRTNKDLHFMRKGKVGDWKNWLTPEMEKDIEAKLLAPLKMIGLNFKDS